MKHLFNQFAAGTKGFAASGNGSRTKALDVVLGLRGAP